MGSFFVFGVGKASAATYYADDAGSGTECTEISPCALSYILVTKISAGDTVKVMPGTYNIALQIQQKSSASNIIVEAYNINDRPVLDGSNLSTGRIFYTYGGTFRYLIFRNVGRVNGYANAAILADDNAPYVIIEHSTFLNAAAFNYRAVSNTFRYNYVENNFFGPVTDSGLDAGEIVDIYSNVFVGGSSIRAGAATGGDANTLTDTTATFTIGSSYGLFSGAIVTNITDNSWGIVKSYTNTGIEFVDNMSQGQWDSGDRYEIHGGLAISGESIVGSGAGTISVYNNVFSGSLIAIRILAGMTGTTNISNNVFAGVRGDENIKNSSLTGTVNVSSNMYLNGAAIGGSSFLSNLTGTTDSGINKLTNWGVAPGLSFPDAYFFYRFDDTDHESCAECTYYYYKDLAIKMQAYDQKGVVGVDVAEVGRGGNYLSWDEIRELQSTYKWEIASHGLSHEYMDNSTVHTSPFSATYTGGETGSIVVDLSGSAPTDSGAITITEGANSLTITYPVLTNLVYTAQRTVGSDNDPWDYSVSNSGMPDPDSYDLGSLKGLRDYIDSLSNWSVVYNSHGYPESTPTRTLANATYDNPSSTALLYDVNRLHYWEMGYSKQVIEYEMGNGYACSTFTYPYYVLDYQTELSLIEHGYTVGLGYNMSSGLNILSSINLYNMASNMVNGMKATDTDGDGISGDEYDIRHIIRSLTNLAGGDRRVVATMSHNAGDVSSMNEWDWIISEVANNQFVKNKTPKEIASIIRGSGDWTSKADGVLWERSEWPQISPSLNSTSPAIDTGTDVSLTSDYAGNPIYGLPDIGSYEYQPTHDMAKATPDEPQIGEAIRVYGDGKFRNTIDDSNENTTDTAKLSIVPQGSATTKWLDLNISAWNTSGDYHKTWTENSGTLGSDNTLHTIGDLAPGQDYSVKIDDVLATANITGTDCVNGICTADENGEITLTYTGGYSEHTFTIEDAAAPTITITDPETGDIVSGDDTITFTDNEPTDPECSLNNSDWTNCQSTVTSFNDLTGWDDIEENDTFTLYMRDTDGAGNTGTANVANLTKADTQAPVRSDGFPSGELASSITQTTLELTTDENATCKYDTASGTSYADMDNTFSTSGTTSHSQTVSGLSAGNTYSYYVRCQDESNNQNDTDYLISFSVANEEDNDNDDERDLNVDKVKATSTENSITIKWKTDHNARSTVRYGTDRNLKEKKKDDDKEKKHKINLTDLLPDTKYYFRIKSEDGDDNEDKSRIHSIMTTAKTTFSQSTKETFNSQAVPSHSGNATPNTCSYTVQSGDSLWKTAQAVYGDGSAYPKIIEKNKDKYPNIDSVLSVGQELVFDCDNNSEVKGISDIKEDDKAETPSIQNQNQGSSETKWWNPFSWF